LKTALEFVHPREMSWIMDKTQMIEKLNEILKWEYAGLVQYTQFSFLVQDTWREVFCKFFRENGEEALKHAHLIGDKIAALGGLPSVERGAVKQSSDLNEMLEYSLEVESLQVRLYTEALALCDDKEVGLRVVRQPASAETGTGRAQAAAGRTSRFLRRDAALASRSAAAHRQPGTG
jgi:bacterioferritin